MEKKKVFKIHWVAQIPSQPLGLLPLKKKSTALTDNIGFEDSGTDVSKPLLFKDCYHSFPLAEISKSFAV